MALAILNNDFLLTLTTRTDVGAVEIGNLPAGIPLNELRWNADTTSLVIMSDTTAVTSMWVEIDANKGFVLHCRQDVANYDSQLVSMTWDDRGNLVNDGGTIRVMTPTELTYETDEFEFNRGIIRSENLIEKQVDYSRKIPSDVIITDSDRTDPTTLAVLYNALDSDYISVDVSNFTSDGYWIQYRFPTEQIIQSVFNYGIYDTTGSNVVGLYYGYSLNGEDWTYLATDSTSHDNTESLVEYTDQTSAIANYVTFTDDLVKDGSIIYRFLRGVSAKYFRLYFLPQSGFINQNDFQISEFRFNPIVHGTTIENYSIGPEKLTFEISQATVATSSSSSTVIYGSGGSYGTWAEAYSATFTAGDYRYVIWGDIMYDFSGTIVAWNPYGYVKTRYRLIRTSDSVEIFRYPEIWSLYQTATGAYAWEWHDRQQRNNVMWMQSDLVSGVEYKVVIETKRYKGPVPGAPPPPQDTILVTATFRFLNIIGFANSS